jgi:DNA integrity scanning protein DisA with diadenylate cyclase activity
MAGLNRYISCGPEAVKSRVARWFLFRTKIPILVNFGWSKILENVDILMVIWHILQTFMIFYDHLVHFVLIWYIFPVWVIFTQKNLTTLAKSTLGKSLLDCRHVPDTTYARTATPLPKKK